MSLSQRLRDTANQLRTSSVSLSDFIPLLQEAADALDAWQTDSTVQLAALDNVRQDLASIRLQLGTVVKSAPFVYITDPEREALGSGYDLLLNDAADSRIRAESYIAGSSYRARYHRRFELAYAEAKLLKGIIERSKP